MSEELRDVDEPPVDEPPVDETCYKDGNERPTTPAEINQNSTPANGINTTRSPWTRPALFDTKAKKIAWGAFASIILLALLIILMKSLKKLDSTEYGIQYNIHSKQLDEAAVSGGLHLGPPGFRFIKFPSTFVTVDLPDGICVSKDGIPIGFAVTFQYQMTQSWLRPAILKYRDFFTWATLVEAAGESAVQHACSDYSVSNFQTKRGVIQSAMETHLRTKLEGPTGDGAGGVYAKAISVQLRNVDLPEEYLAAVAEKQGAVEEVALAINQRKQEVTKAQTLLLTAQEKALQILDTARNEANVTMTEALLRAQETFYGFENEAIVLAQIKGSLNLTTNGLLSYLANQLYADVQTLKVKAGEPAKLSRKDEL